MYNISGVKACIDLGANPNIPDNLGMFACDFILMLNEPEHVVRFLDELSKNAKDLVVHKDVYEKYGENYKYNFNIVSQN
jgi:hypothetical protein